MKEIRFSNLISPNGDFKRLEGINAIVDSYTKLLSIKRGSYPFDPEVGTEITKYLFDLNDSVTLELVRDEVLETLEQEDRAKISNVSITPIPTEKSLYISVHCKIIDANIKSNVELNFTVTPENTTFVNYRLLEDVQ